MTVFGLSFLCILILNKDILLIINNSFLLRIAADRVPIQELPTNLPIGGVFVYDTGMNNFTVFCPYAPEEQTTLTDEWKATELCLDLADEFGYACVRDAWGNLHLDYGDVCQAVEDGVI